MPVLPLSLRRRPCGSPRAALRGFTLVELAVVLAIVAILLRVASPGLSRGAASRALAAQASEFMAALRFARAQALARGAAVTICASLPGASEPACQGPRSADWRSGWLVFADRDRRGAPNPHEPVLRVQQPLQRSGGVAGTRGSISFTAAGYATDAASRYVFDPPPAAVLDAPPSLTVCVSKQGRPRLADRGVCD
jgi:type IV fimbrial biogenesis protein FimT